MTKQTDSRDGGGQSDTNELTPKTAHRLINAFIHHSKALALVDFLADDGIGMQIAWANDAFLALVGSDIACFDKELLAFVHESRHLGKSKSMQTVLPSWTAKEDFFMVGAIGQGDGVLLSIEDHSYVKQLEQVRTNFVGNVSHELRTPLTVILGYLEYFVELDVDAKMHHGLVRMQEQAIRMNNLVSDLLLLSRLESTPAFEMTQIDMPRLLTQIFDEVQLHNTNTAHLIDLHLDTQDKVMGQWLYLHSAILNLAINAVKYTPEGGEISISWERMGDGCLLSVSDNGIGIEPEHLERLTERFYRVDAGRSRATGGTGIGLAIVKHVIHKHGAKLNIRSTKSVGSVFEVFFDKSSVIRIDD